MSCKVSDIKPERKSFRMADILECQKRWTEPKVPSANIIEVDHIDYESSGPPRELRYLERRQSYPLEMPSYSFGLPALHEVNLRHFHETELSPYYQIYPHLLKSSPLFMKHFYQPEFAGSYLFPSPKRKGGQVRFTPQQTQMLEKRFLSNKYLSPEERRSLAMQLQLSDRQVKTWFQNRRAKFRRISGPATTNESGKPSSYHHQHHHHHHHDLHSESSYESELEVDIRHND